MKKIFITSALLIPLLFSAISYPVSAENSNLKLKLQIGSKKVVINDTTTAELLQSPFIKESKTYVPIRFISERLNADVKWDQKKKQVTIIKDNNTITLTINSKQVVVNNTNQSLESPALIINGTTFVPLRFVSQNLNANVVWEQSTKSITIQTSSGTSVTPTPSPSNPTVKTENEKIKDVLQKQIDYLNNKDAAGAISLSYKPIESVEQLQSNLDTYNMEYELDGVTDIKINGSEASALVSRIAKRYAVAYTPEGPEKYLEVNMKLVLDTSLVKVNGEWKIYRVATKSSTNLNQK